MRATRTSDPTVTLAFGVTALVGIFLCGAAGRPPQALGAALPDNPPDAKRAEPIPFPDGVTDSARQTAFVSSPKGGIQAVRLEDGKVLWTNDECKAEPWLVAGERLIARGERLFVLDLKEGKQLRQCDALAYPKVEVPDRCTVSFNLLKPRVGDTLEANWYALAHIDRSKGRPFAFEALTKFNKAVPTGKIKVNLETGKTEVQTDPKPTDLTTGQVPEVMKPDRLPAGSSEKLAAVWQEYDKDQNGRITLLDGRLVGVAMKLEQMGMEYSKRIILNAWELKSGMAAEPVELVKGKALDIANIALTADRRHAAVQFSTSALTIYSLTIGKPVAKELKGVSSIETAFVDGKHLYHIVRANNGDQTLKAIDLESSKTAWERAIKPRPNIPLPP